ncbi:winged helix-turn-helix transcriptional regulator [Micromonospora sp. NPDC048830]|uniref:winged helix-turn-helix transcriptional regulator n=1 Tax=Micromonospora sp. NPDC048830 TaxID=3364257 RepID=UPI00371499B3
MLPAQVDYRLTETGASLTHLVKALADWSLAHRAAIAQARQAYDGDHPDNDIR